MTLRTTTKNPNRERPAATARSHRPAVVEHVDLPQSTSDGRATSRARALGTQIVTFALVIVALVVRPSGLFGRAEVKKV